MSSSHSPLATHRRFAPLWTLAGVALSAGVLWWLFSHLRLHLGDLRAAWASADRLVLGLTLAFSVSWHVLVGAHKLKLVLDALGAPIGYADAVRLRLGEGPARMLLPMRGGEILTVVYFWRRQRLSLPAAAGALAFDRGLNLSGLLLWLLTGSLLLPGGAASHAVAGVAVLAVCYLGFLFLTPLHDALISAAGRIHRRAGELARGMLRPWRELSAGRKLALSAYGLVFVTRPLLVCWLLFAAHGVVVGLAETLAYGSLAVLAGTVPGPLMGIGPREGAVALLFADLAAPGSGVPLGVGLLMSLAVHVLPFAAGAPWIGWFLRRIAEASGDATDED